MILRVMMGAVAFWACVGVSAQDFPSKPVHLIVPFGAGTNTDILARTLSDKLAARLGQSIVVENRPGAGGNLGAAYVANAAPDGYTILFGAASVLAINSSLFASMPYDASTLVPITQVANVPNALVIDPALPFKSVADLVEFARRNPGKLNFASAGQGGSVHLSGELFKSVTGTDIVHVLYQSAPPAHVDIMGGRVQMIFDGVPSVLPLIQSGKLRALAVTSAARVPSLPNVPTMQEAGIRGFDVVGWYGVVAPPKTPAPIVERLNRALVATLNDPDVARALRDRGAEPVGNSPAEFGAFIASEAKRWKKVIGDAGIKLN